MVLKRQRCSYFPQVIQKKKKKQARRLRATDHHLSNYWRPLHKSLFICSYANSITAADARWHAVRMNIHHVSAWRCRVCPGRGSNQGKAVLPSDWPRVLCQGFLQSKGSADIKGRLPGLNPAVACFPVHLRTSVPLTELSPKSHQGLIYRNKGGLWYLTLSGSRAHCWVQTWKWNNSCVFERNIINTQWFKH